MMGRVNPQTCNAPAVAPLVTGPAVGRGEGAAGGGVGGGMGGAVRVGGVVRAHAGRQSAGGGDARVVPLARALPLSAPALVRLARAGDVSAAALTARTELVRMSALLRVLSGYGPRTQQHQPDLLGREGV
ncbi:unnamed protein product, partial [Closterium sp. NIES-65]